MKTIPTSVGASLSLHEQAVLGKIARFAIERAFAGKGPVQQAADVPSPKEETLLKALGVFVTLHRNGALRGCIGTMQSAEPLYMTTARMAYAAAFQDHRFPPLRPEEWPQCDLELSVLGPLTPCPDPSQIEIGKHGLLLVHAGKSGVFLPQVPVEQGWQLATYLEQLCYKAGLPAGSWKAPGAQLYWYEAFVFSPPVE